MAETFELEVATPERLVIREQVREAQIPAETGMIGVLPQHAPLLSELGTGELSYMVGPMKHALVISGGGVLTTYLAALRARRVDPIVVLKAD